MATVIRRSDMRIFPSVNTPDYPEPTYKTLTSAEAVSALQIPQYYRIFDGGDNVVEMDAAAKAAVDAARIDTMKAQAVDAVVDTQSYSLLRALVLVILDELNLHQTDIATICADPQVNVTPQTSQRTVAQLKAALKGKM